MTTFNNTAKFYESSYQFKVESTELNISFDYVQMVLAKQYEYRPTQDSLWAIVQTTEGEKRFIFDYANGLSEIN